MASEIDQNVYTDFPPPEHQDQENEEDFASLLKLLRGDVISQSALGRSVELDESYVSLLESRKRSPKKETVELFVQRFGLDDETADRLRASAGFRGEGNTISYKETELLAVNALILDPETTENAKEAIRAELGNVVTRHLFMLGTSEG